MSQFSEIMGSFVRTGNYPIEANYIFNSEEELKEFFSDEINNTLLHKGLFKIVSSGNLQTLYWVVSRNGNLLFIPLILSDSIDKLFERMAELRVDLTSETSARKLAISSLLGTDDILDFLGGLDNLLAISNTVIELLEKSSDCSNVLNAIVGSNEENLVEYLKTLDYSNLTEISKLLNKFFNTVDVENAQLNTFPELLEFLKDFDYTKSLYSHLRSLYDEIEGTPVPNGNFKTLRGIQDFILTLASAVSNREDNLLTELDQVLIGVGLSQDGSFSPDLETNYLKDATSIMNALKTLDGLIAKALRTFELVPIETNSASITIDEGTTSSNIYADVKISNESDIVVNSDGLYVKLSTEYIDGILTIKVNGDVRSLHNLAMSSIIDNAYYDSESESLILNFKNSLRVEIPVEKLIEEWEINNPDDKVIELNRLRIVLGADKLSADVRISSKLYNILSKDGNTLYVKGTSDNLYHDNLLLSSVVESILEDVETTLLQVLAELNRAISSENTINESVNLVSSLINDLKLNLDWYEG